MMGNRVLKMWLEQEELKLFVTHSEAALEGGPDVADLAAGEVRKGYWITNKGGLYSTLITI